MTQTHGRRGESEVEEGEGCGGKEGGLGVAKAEMESGRMGGGRSEVRGGGAGVGGEGETMRGEGEGGEVV